MVKAVWLNTPPGTKSEWQSSFSGLTDFKLHVPKNSHLQPWPALPYQRCGNCIHLHLIFNLACALKPRRQSFYFVQVFFPFSQPHFLYSVFLFFRWPEKNAVCLIYRTSDLQSHQRMHRISQFRLERKKKYSFLIMTLLFVCQKSRSLGDMKKGKNHFHSKCILAEEKRRNRNETSKTSGS